MTEEILQKANEINNDIRILEMILHDVCLYESASLCLRTYSMASMKEVYQEIPDYIQKKMISIVEEELKILKQEFKSL